MKKMIRFACLLLALFVLPCGCLADGLPASAREIVPQKLTDGLLLKVQENGQTRAIHVLWQNEHCYVPAETLEQLTCYLHEETGSAAGQFIRRDQYLSGHHPLCYVEYDGESRQIKLHTWYQIYFFPMDGVLERDGIRYLPLDQVLPFLHVQWTQEWDQLVLVNDPYTLDDVLTYRDELIFQMDDIVDGGFFASRMAQVSNFMIDALLNFRVEYFVPAFDEVNGLSGSQGVHDNVEAVVKGYLADDEAYLADDGAPLTAGNGYLYDQTHPTAARTVKDLRQLKSDSAALKKYLGYMKLNDLKKELDALHLDQFLTAAQAMELCESMLTDHYRMLDAMFNFSGAHAGAVSDGYFAQITRYVWESYADTWTAMTSELLRTQTTDALTRELRSGIRGKFLTTTQGIILDTAKRMVSLFTNADQWSKSMVKNYYHDAFAALARDRVDSLLRQELNHQNLEDVRLCALMMLTASRQGFEELADFYDAQKSDMQDAVQVLRDQAEKVKHYQQILYLCYDSIDRDCPDDCRAAQGELYTLLRRMHDAGQVYDFDPYAYEGIEISVWPDVASTNEIAVTTYQLKGESEYQWYSVNLPVFKTGDPATDEWLWQEISEKLYAKHAAEKKLSREDSDYGEYFKDSIAISYRVSLGYPDTVFIRTYYTNTPVRMADRYYEVQTSYLYDLRTRSLIEPYQLFTVSKDEFNKRMIKAIIYSQAYQDYLQKGRERGVEDMSSVGSLALVAITEEGWIYEEDDPSGVAYYATNILVPWNEIPFSPSEYAGGYRGR